MGKTISQRNRQAITKEKTIQDKIFDCLRENKNEEFTQTELARRLFTSQSTISRHIEEMLTKTYDVYSKTYKVEKVESRYRVVVLDKNGNYDNVDDYNAEAEEIEKIGKSHILKGKYAQQITSTVIFYEIYTRYRSIVKESLRKLYGNGIITMLDCEKGLYIILKENKDLEKNRANILELYDKAIKKYKKRNI